MRKRVRAPRSISRSRYGQKSKKVKMVQAIGQKAMQRRLAGSAAPACLHYSTRIALNPSVGGVAASYVFRLSSIFDPDFTGVGHQPVGHDQLEPLYERYQVWKVDFHVEFANRSTTENQRVGYRISDSSSTSSDPDVNVENGNCEWRLITPGGDSKMFTGTVQVPKVHGVSYKQYMSNDDYGANFGNNPAEEAYFHLWADGLGDDTDPVDAAIHLVYHVKLMGSKLTALS